MEKIIEVDEVCTRKAIREGRYWVCPFCGYKEPA